MNHLSAGLFLAAIGFVFLWIAFQLRFFRVKSLPPIDMHLYYPLLSVVGYLLLFFILVPFMLHLMGDVWQKVAAYSPALLITLLQLASLSFGGAYLFVVWVIQKPTVRKGLWIHPHRQHLPCVLEDIGLGIVSCIIAFPLVGASSQIIEFLTSVLTNYTPADQIAVRYVKMVQTSPPLLVCALFIVLIAGPTIEEFVFRALLYTALKRRFSPLVSIALSSLVFAAFHFSIEQGLSNLALIGSLFIFALFLGFLYERQRSLFAPIALHMTFNSISVIRVLLN